MMKKLVLLLGVVSLLSNKVWADGGEFVWSYGALAETMREMRDNCEPTNGEPFVAIGNWMREKKAKFSAYDFFQVCKDAGMEDIDRTSTEPASDKVVPTCQLPNKNCHPVGINNGKQEYNCGEVTGLSKNKGCEIFFATFKKYNNKRAEILQDRKPGTYVSKVKDKEGVYQVVDVVLADGYWIRDWKEKAKGKVAESPMINPFVTAARYGMDAENSIDMAVNTAEENTKIWEITEDGTPRETEWHTWTNDMFLGVTAAKDAAGNVTGALSYSFIFPEMDVTREVYDNMLAVGNQVSDIPEYVVQATRIFKDTKSLHDPKIYFPNKYPDLKSQQYYSEYEGKYRPQKEADVHSNGVLFEGKIAMLDWLGNMMVGLNLGKLAQRPGKHENVPGGVQYAIKKAGHGAAHGGQIVVDAKAAKNLADFDVNPEPLKAQQAWALGEEFFANNLQVLYDYQFKTVPTIDEALTKARQLIEDTYGKDFQVLCDADCERPNSVYCTYDKVDGTSGTVLVRFGEICKKEVNNEFNGLRVTPSQAVRLVGVYNYRNTMNESDCKRNNNQVECSKSIFQFANISESIGSESYPRVADTLCKMIGGSYVGNNMCDGIYQANCEGDYKNLLQELIPSNVGVKFVKGTQFGTGSCVIEFK